MPAPAEHAIQPQQHPPQHDEDAQHAHGNERRYWSDIVGADPTDLARAYYAAHEADEDFEPVLRRFIPTRPE